MAGLYLGIHDQIIIAQGVVAFKFHGLASVDRLMCSLSILFARLRSRLAAQPVKIDNRLV
jgi:hypothetical protein